MIPLQMARQCGECDACCTIMSVTEINKPNNVKCQHCSNGCLIYNNRPIGCATWSCSWLLGLVPGEENRPDKLGVMFNKSNYFEVWEGASKQDKAKELITKLQAVKGMTLDDFAEEFYSNQ